MILSNVKAFCGNSVTSSITYLNKQDTILSAFRLPGSFFIFNASVQFNVKISEQSCPLPLSLMDCYHCVSGGGCGRLV